MRSPFPFSAVVGQEDLKLALLLVAIDPTIGGVLISGDRGTAKSTVARAIAALLPSRAADHAAPFVELPLGATEDRVVGALDISKVLQDGRTELRSGLLAQAHGGVLYVDEVNLLADHLVDLLLDAAASGWVTVERDGISTRESAEFILIGTMNPEEGELRPQFLDRFGLCAHAQALEVADTRIAAIRQRLSFDYHPAKVLEAFREEEDASRAAIQTARGRLTGIAIGESHLSRVAQLCIEHQLAGIRGDLALLKAARALAAWEGVSAIDETHLVRVTAFALNHRKRRPRTPARHPANTAAGRSPPRPATGNETPAGAIAAPPTGSPKLQSAPAAPAPENIGLQTEAVDPDQVGRQGARVAAARQTVRAVPFTNTGTLAITETLTAAAQRGARMSTDGIRLKSGDLRQYERRGPGTSHVLLLVDASGSMATQRRLSLAKGIAAGLLTASYQRRDEVALMIFRGEGTDLVLPFTRDVARVEQALDEVPTGGRTPLAQAMREAADLLQTRAPALLVLLTDGRANVAPDGEDPWEAALAACAPLRAAAAGALVIDCEPGPIILGRAPILAARLGAECVALEALDVADLTLRIHLRLATL